MSHSMPFGFSNWAGHMWQPESLVIAFVAACFVFMLSFVVAMAYRRYLRCGYGQAVGWAWLASALMYGCIMLPLVQGYDLGGGPLGALSLLARGLVFVFAVPFAVRQFRMWLFDIANERERRTGSAGFGAAFGFGNILCMIGIILCGWMGWWLSPIVLTTGVVGLVLAYPAVNTLGENIGLAEPPTPEAPTNLNEERERVMAMLEDGRITVEESKELLQALGQTIPSHRTMRPLMEQHRLSIIGAAVVLAAFFLPWFGINLGNEMNRMTRQWMPQSQRHAEQMDMLRSTVFDWAGMKLQTPTAYIHGGDIGRGMGWMVLAASILAAMAMFISLFPSVEPNVGKLISLSLLGVGSILVMYLLTTALRHIHIGIIAVAVGYAFQWIGLLRSGIKMPQSPPAPAVV